MEETLVLVAVGVGAGAALGVVFAHAPSVVRKLFGLGAVAALVAGVMFSAWSRQRA